MVPLLTIYDDSLDNRWELTPVRNCEIESDDKHHNSHSLVCGRSIKLTLNAVGQGVIFRATEAVSTWNSSRSLALSFMLILPKALHWSPCLGAVAGTLQQCAGPLCIAIRDRKDNLRRLFVPLCALEVEVTSGDTEHNWKQFRLPFRSVDVESAFDEIAFVANALPIGTTSVLSLDELRIESDMEQPIQSSRLPSYGRTVAGQVRGEWGVKSGGAASLGQLHGNRHFCEYLTSELAPRNSTRPFCKIFDGDHMHGRWMQTCDPRLILRPDKFAYGQALPAIRGGTDFLVCYRQSAAERLRAVQALSWSWRPYACALRP